jgi:hypothetical protein
LFTCDIDGQQRQDITAIGSPIGALSHLWWVERVLRAGFHSIDFRSDTEIIAVAKGRVLTVDLDAGELRCDFKIINGSRPLNVTTTPDGLSCFGEYFGNTDRQSVRIFATDDGSNWDCVHEFPSGSIRHVHGIYYDRFRDGLWVLTGDDGEEAAIWFTDDNFRNLQAVVRGKQRCRAVSVIPMLDGLIVPMDAPDEQNYIHHLDVSNTVFRRVAELPGTSFASTLVGECMLVSTVVERSSFNTDQHVSVWGSVDGEHWHCVSKWHRDLAFTRNFPPYLQHPTIYFAKNGSLPERIFAFAVGIKGLDGRMISWPRAGLESWLGSNPETA